MIAIKGHKHGITLNDFEYLLKEKPSENLVENEKNLMLFKNEEEAKRFLINNRETEQNVEDCYFFEQVDTKN
jgi:hypothetical protein